MYCQKIYFTFHEAEVATLLGSTTGFDGRQEKANQVGSLICLYILFFHPVTIITQLQLYSCLFWHRGYVPRLYSLTATQTALEETHASTNIGCDDSIIGTIAPSGTTACVYMTHRY